MRKLAFHSQYFKPEASRAREGIAVIFDIAGFSSFFNQPDVHNYIPQYLNHIIKCVEISLFGGKNFWRGDKAENIPPLPVIPVHQKFLGDGVLYVWSPKESKSLSKSLILPLTNRLWNIQMQFSEINKACVDFIPVAELPSGIRFGVARGTIFELSVENSREKEYIGVCLNLASRLEKYCSGLNFIASARLGLATSDIKGMVM